MTMKVSPAQAPPVDVLRLTMQYLVEKAKPLHRIAVDKQESLRELLYVSSAWRQGTLEYMWENLILTLDSKNNRVLVNNPSYAKNVVLQANTSLVRALYIVVSMSNIISGEACRLLSEFMGDITSLPLASKLTIVLTKDLLEPDFEMESGVANAQYFSRLLRSITETSLESTEVKYADVWLYMTEPVEDIFGMFVNSICGNSKHSKLDMDHIILNQAGTIHHIPSLSSLDLRHEYRSQLCLDLLYKCANTLLSLSIRTEQGRDIIYDRGDNAVLYPNLQHLFMYTLEFRDFQRVHAPGIVPFPKLKSLRILMVYPFADDVLFRGNRDTLEYLEIRVDRYTMDMVNKSPEFNYRRRCLRKVVVGDGPRSLDLANAPQADITELLSRLAGKAQMLNLSSIILVNALIAADPLATYFKDIQLLKAKEVGISLFKIMKLLILLPVLQKLWCGFDGLGSELEKIQSKKLPDHISSTYGDVGKHLYELRVDFTKITRRDKAARFIMNLALACPNLRGVTSIYPWFGDYLSGVSEILETDKSYSKYAPRLRQLLNYTRVSDSSSTTPPKHSSNKPIGVASISGFGVY